MTDESKHRFIREALEEFIKRHGSLDRDSRVDDLPSCSFCGKKNPEVQKLIAGPNVYICNECIRLCVDILKEENLWSD